MSAPDIAAAVREFRTSLGLSQAEFAGRLSTVKHQQSIYKVETGRRGLSALELAEISVVFGVPMDAVVFGDVSPDDPSIRAAAMSEKLAAIAAVVNA